MESFDYVVNNQVLEHVEDMPAVLGEISRVLKPGGAMLSPFPDKGVWREGHCGIAFLHWFPKGSRLRVYYAGLLHLFGLGYHKGDKSVLHWSADFCDWLDKWTHYRPRREINMNFSQFFGRVSHIEDYWLRQRLGLRYKWAAIVPLPIQRWVVSRLAGLVFVAVK